MKSSMVSFEITVLVIFITIRRCWEGWNQCWKCRMWRAQPSIDSGSVQTGSATLFTCLAQVIVDKIIWWEFGWSTKWLRTRRKDLLGFLLKQHEVVRAHQDNFISILLVPRRRQVWSKEPVEWVELKLQSIEAVVVNTVCLLPASLALEISRYMIAAVKSYWIKWPEVV